MYSIFENKLIGTIEVIGTSVQQQLGIVFNKGGGSATEIDFGVVYFGQTKELSAFLVNNGPNKINYKFFFHPDKDPEQIVLNESDFNCTPQEAGIEMSQRILSAEPINGLVNPYEQIPIKFKCKTTIPVKNLGWRKDMSQFNEKLYNDNPELQNDKVSYPKTNIKATAAVQFDVGGENKIELKNPNEPIAKIITVFMKVQACYPEFTLDKTMLNFWECKVYERKKITIRIINKHVDLPLDFSFNKISSFTATPNSGLIVPATVDSNSSRTNLNSVDVDIVFHPESLGNSNDVIMFRYINNTFSFPIRVQGMCKEIGKVTV